MTRYKSLQLFNFSGFQPAGAQRSRQLAPV
jgi:hypothetical protein